MKKIKIKESTKAILIGIAAIYVIGISVLAYNQYSIRRQVEQELTSTINTYDRIIGDSMAKLDSIEAAKNLIIAGLSKENDKNVTLYQEERKRSRALQAKLDAITAAPINVTPDSSYAYVNEVYPAASERLYALDTFQIKTFHRVDLAYKANRILTESLYKSLDYCDNLVLNLSAQTQEYKELYGVAVKKYDMALAVNRSLIIELGDISYDLIKQRRLYKHTLIGITAAIATGTILIILN